MLNTFIGKRKQIKLETNPCLDTSIYSQELEDFPSQPDELEELKQLNSLKSIPIARKSSTKTSPPYPSTIISEPTIQNQDSSTSLREDLHAKTSALLGNKQELQAIAPHSGLNSYESLSKVEQISLFGKTSLEHLATDLTQFSGAWPKAGMMRSGKLYQHPPLEHHTDAIVSSLLPTPQAYSFQKSHSPGQTKLDLRLRMLPTPTAHLAKEMGAPSEATRNQPSLHHILGLMPGQVLNPQFVEWMQGFPIGWTDLQHSATQLCPNVPRSPCNEFCTSIPHHPLESNDNFCVHAIAVRLSDDDLANLDQAREKEGVGRSTFIRNAIRESPLILESQIHINDRYQVKQSDGWLKGTVRSISDTHFRFEWDETYIGGVLKLDASFALTWIRGIQNGHSPPKLHLAPPKDGILGDKPSKEKDRAAKPIGGTHPARNPLELQKLLEERSLLLSQKIAPDNCWVETGQATKTFRQCWYRSKHPIFDNRKSRYIGREDSPAAREARQAIARRNRLRIIEKKLRLLHENNHS